MPNTEITVLSIKHVDIYLEHLKRHYREPGIDGSLAHPYSWHQEVDTEPMRKKILKRLNITDGKGGWERVWALFHENRIVGHINLIAHDHPALQHRLRLGLGLEIPFRSQGYGSKLLSIALKFAKGLNSIDWIDLDVFAENKAAIALYRKFGFQNTGIVPDRLRVDQQSIDDIQMSLDLRTFDENLSRLSPRNSKSRMSTVNAPGEDEAAAPGGAKAGDSADRSHSTDSTDSTDNTDNTEYDASADHKASKYHLFNLKHLDYRELKNRHEIFSHSAILTDLLGFRNLFVHHEILPPGRRASTPHYHTHIEEMFLILKGHATVCLGNKKLEAKPGDFIGFPPNSGTYCTIANHSADDVHILGITSDHPLDETIYSKEK